MSHAQRVKAMVCDFLENISVVRAACEKMVCDFLTKRKDRSLLFFWNISLALLCVWDAPGSCVGFSAELLSSVRAFRTAPRERPGPVSFMVTQASFPASHILGKFLFW